jgi:transcriptional regulator with XRE-family HTH domain
MSVNDNIRRYRKQTGMTQEETAQKAGISRTYYADVERGRYNPSLPVLKKIAAALGVTADVLISEEDRKDIDIRNNSKSVDNLALQIIDQLIDTGKIKSIDDIDKVTEEIILSSIKTYIALKIKERNN